MELDYNKLGKCFEKILETDRYNWDKFHEDFVLTLVEFGYGCWLTDREQKWHKDYAENGENYLGIDDYTW
jgi:hypothetical protein